MTDIKATPQFQTQIAESFIGAFRITMLVGAALALAASGVALLWVEGGRLKGEAGAKDEAERAKGEG